MFKIRSGKLERIDVGDYTAEEYAVFLREIAFINRYLGDRRALKRTLLQEIESTNVRDFSVLDVGAGSGEMLRTIAEFARRTKRTAELTGIEINECSAKAILETSADFPEIKSVRGDALKLPFAENSFDYCICTLFTHHLSDENVVHFLQEMNRVSTRGIFVIDLHRHPMAYALYQLFCSAFRISPLVREDGSLSILRSFKPDELRQLSEKAGLKNVSVTRSFPFRVVLKIRGRSREKPAR